jgi:solute carrier family 25 protein 39/40
VHFFSGAVAGGAVAALTTPLDVVKTRVQIRDAPSLLDFAGGMSKRESGCVSPANAAAIDTVANRVKSQSRGLFGELAAVARHGGLSSLFAGWAPRAARAGPTCGIVLVAYEMAKNAPV